MISRKFALAAFAGITALSSLASAGVQTPGSLIVFPVFDNRLYNGSLRNLTLLSVTNTHPSESVEVHFVYRNGVNCLQTDRFELLTANDTFSAITAFHNPNQEQGYCYVYARNPVTHAAIKFDHLTAVQMDLRGDLEEVDDASFEFTPFVFKAAGQRRLSQGMPTDVDGDGLRDLNGSEYETVSDVLYFPRFFGQSTAMNGLMPQFKSDLVLINLTGGKLFDAIVHFEIFNDNEVPTSAEYMFRCWARVPLAGDNGINNAFNDDYLRNSTDNDPQEAFGAPSGFPETGWFSIDGVTADSTAASFGDPAILGVLIENDRGQNRSGGAVMPFGSVLAQDNGDLLSLGLLGDTDDLP